MSAARGRRSPFSDITSRPAPQVRKWPAGRRALRHDGRVKAADYARLIALAAIWGASFIFMRVAAPALGAVLTAEGRLLIAGLVLTAWFRFTGFDAQWKRYAGQYAAIGVVNMALPSLLYAFALMHIPASLAAILNSTAPMFGALFAAFLLGERLGARKSAGFIAGIAGVALVVRPDAFAHIPMFGATRALTVTYLMPFFGLLWGMLFLGESLPVSALAGGVLILAGTVLVTRG